MARGDIIVKDSFLYPEWANEAVVEHGTFNELSKYHIFVKTKELSNNSALWAKPLFLVNKKSLKNTDNNFKKLARSEYFTFSLREFEELAMLGFIFCNINDQEILRRVVNAWVEKYTLPCYSAVNEYRRSRGFYNYGRKEFSVDVAMHEHWKLSSELEELNPNYYFIFETTLRGIALDAYFVYMALLISYENKPIITLVELDMAKNETLRNKLYRTFIEHEFLQSQKIEDKYTNVVDFKLLSQLVLGYKKYDKWSKNFYNSMEKAKLARTNEAIRLVEEKFGSELYSSVCSIVNEYIYRVSSSTNTNKQTEIKSFTDIEPAYMIPDKLSKVWFDCYNFIVFNAKDNNLCVRRCNRPQCSSLFITTVNKEPKKQREYCCDNCREVYRNFRSRHGEEETKNRE